MVCTVAMPPEVNPFFLAPFAVLLLGIALMPFIHGRFWEHHYPEVAIGLGLVCVIYYGPVLGEWGAILHTGHEYVSFMALVGSLYVVSGGILVSVRAPATPWANAFFLAGGCVLANLIGTTGASMVLIRPWIRMNRGRIAAFHVVFFIFIISNCAGCLTPIGDPPLFLGFLRGVPFFWIFWENLAAWAAVNAVLIGTFLVLDFRLVRRLRHTRPEDVPAVPEVPCGIRGRRNFAFLAVIIGAVFIDSPAFLRELIMLAAATASHLTTPKSVHEANQFNFAPLREVAFLFLGIFATMMPVLDHIKRHAAEMGLSTELQFYFSAGLLSSFLDNAPTYLTFLTTGISLFPGYSVDDRASVLRFALDHGPHVVAVSLGAVFFGAMTYIGNAPNFMVKSIAEQQKVRMPSFFGYIFRYSVPVLLPVLVVVGWWLFGRGR